MKKYLLLVLLPLFLLAACKKDKPVDTDDLVPLDFLSSGKFTSLVVEVVSVSGYAPSQASLDNLSVFLNTYLNKPAGISFVQSTISSPGKTVYSTNDIRGLEKKYRSYKPHDKTLTAYLFFADGDHDENTTDEKVLGVAYAPSSLVIYKKTVQDYSGGVGQPSETVLESAILLHEFGHILGLVNFGTSAQTAHEDTAHPNHCNVESCLMYWLIGTGTSTANLLGGTIPGLDAQCIADLKANGGK